MHQPRILVVTVVHHPWDARIWHREIASLRERDWQVTYAAPFTGYGLEVPAADAGFRALDLPRSQGRHRWRAQRAARALLAEQAGAHDVVLLHDPELLTATVGLDLPPLVWDVHEDNAAAVRLRAWLPGPLRGVTAAGVRRAERWAERRMTLLLADYHYAERFAGTHPIVPNTTYVPADPPPAGTPDEHGRLRVVYLGSATLERGAVEMAEVGRRLRAETGDRVRLQVIGPAHGPAATVLQQAAEAGDLDWPGFVPNEEALQQVEGALAGLSLLHDAANFRPSMPTKVVEYMARGVPVITTPLPVPVELVTSAQAGTVVPFGDTDAVVRQLLAWADDPAAAAAVGRQGHEVARERLDWRRHASTFAEALRRAAEAGTGSLHRS